MRRCASEWGIVSLMVGTAPFLSFRRTNVTPAKAGAESIVDETWIPAFAGMTTACPTYNEQ